MKRWISQERILHWFWDISVNDILVNRKLENDDELVEWCWQHNCKIHNTYIICPNKETFIMFGLRWT